jgi:hypothetical protein
MVIRESGHVSRSMLTDRSWAVMNMPREFWSCPRSAIWLGALETNRGASHGHGKPCRLLRRPPGGLTGGNGAHRSNIERPVVAIGLFDRPGDGTEVQGDRHNSLSTAGAEVVGQAGAVMDEGLWSPPTQHHTAGYQSVIDRPNHDGASPTRRHDSSRARRCIRIASSQLA